MNLLYLGADWLNICLLSLFAKDIVPGAFTTILQSCSDLSQQTYSYPIYSVIFYLYAFCYLLYQTYSFFSMSELEADISMY